MVFLYSKSINSVLDAREQTNRLRGRSTKKNGEWLYPEKATPLAQNQFNFNDQIVISEICYNPPGLAAIDAIPTMKIHEFQAKQVLSRYGVPVPRSKVAESVEEAVDAARELGGEVWVVKAQIHAGGTW